MTDFLAAFGLFLVFEGLVYGGFPRLAKTAAAEMASMPEGLLRVAGTIAVALGVLVVWIVRS